MKMLSDLFSPRGLELYVPALAVLRREWWPRMDAELQLALEVADYVGLEFTASLAPSRLEEIASVLPGHLWGALARREMGSGELLLSLTDGIVALIGSALAVDQVN